MSQNRSENHARSGHGPRRKRDYNISQVQFCETWQKSESAEECARKLGMPKPIVIARAAAYRGQGVPLKKMQRRPRNILDVEALTRFLEELDAPKGEPTDVPMDIEHHIHELTEA